MNLTAFLVGFGFLVGGALGSFIKAISDRSMSNRKFTGRSYCEYCKKELKWYDLIPVLSYLFLRGRCRYCKKKLSLEYVLVEVLMGLLIALLFFVVVPENFFDLTWRNQTLIAFELLIKSLIISVLMICLLTDLKTGYIFDRITYPAIVLLFLLLVADTIFRIYTLYQGMASSPLGKLLLPPHSDYFQRHALITAEPLISAVGSLFLMILFFGTIIFATKGRGMGGGDLKLGAFIGLSFGFPLSMLVLMLSFLTGSVVGVFLLIFGKKKFGQTIPFGPFLSLGSLVTLFWGDQILNWYLNYQLF